METRSILPHLAKSGSCGWAKCPARGGACAAVAAAESESFRVRLDVVFADASAGAGAFDFVDVDADFARQTPHVRRGGNGLTMFGAGNFAQLRRHGEHGRGLLRLVGRQRLFFGFAFGANRGLKCEARAVLSGNVFDRERCGSTGFGWCWCSAFEREDHLSDFDLLAFFYFNVFDDAADRRRNFDHGFVGFQFHDRLAFGNLVPGAIIRRTRSPCEMFSPSSGSLNSLGPEGLVALGAAGAAATGGCRGGHCGRLILRNRRQRGCGLQQALARQAAQELWLPLRPR